MTSVLTLNNWIVKMNLSCTSTYNPGLFSLIYFFGTMTGSSFLPRMADVYGRWAVLIFSLVVHLLSYFVVVYYHLIYFYFCMLFLMGLVFPALYYVVIIYATEFVQQKWMTLIAVIFIAGSNLSSLWIALYFQNKFIDWIYLQEFCLILTALITLLILIYLPESPKFLIVNGKTEKALKILKNLKEKNEKTCCRKKRKVQSLAG